MISLGADDDGRTIAVAVGDDVEVTLDEPRGGGYLWSFEVPAGLRETADTATTAGAAPGAVGRRSLRLAVAEPGVHIVRARLARPWEQAVARELAITLDAR